MAYKTPCNLVPNTLWPHPLSHSPLLTPPMVVSLLFLKHSKQKKKQQQHSKHVPVLGPLH